MKCTACGAEIGNNKVCEYCGTRISVEMQKEQEQLNKQGCPKCGSTDIHFERETSGEVQGKNSKQVVYHTVGYCNNCGYTWYPQSETAPVPKKRKTWLWVLGWLFCFPIPLTILLLRKKEMNPILKYGIIVVAWIIYLIIGFSKNGSESTTATSAETNNPAIVQEDKSTSDNATIEKAETVIEDSSTTDEQNEQIVFSDDVIVTFLNGQGFSGTWKASGDGFFVFYPEGDLADAFNQMSAYYALHREIPDELKSSFKSMLDGMKDLSSSVDNATGKMCSLAVANPANTDNILIAFASGEVYYNAFDE